MKNKKLLKLLILNSKIEQYSCNRDSFYFDSFKIDHAGIPLWLEVKVNDCNFFFFVFSKTVRKILKFYKELKTNTKEKKIKELLLSKIDKNVLRTLKIDNLK